MAQRNRYGSSNFYERVREIPDYDPAETYTPKQLDEIATKILYEEKMELEAAGIKDEGPVWLHPAQLFRRRWVEVYNEFGVAEPDKFSGMFHRSYRAPRQTAERKSQLSSDR